MVRHGRGALWRLLLMTVALSALWPALGAGAASQTIVIGQSNLSPVITVGDTITWQVAPTDTVTHTVASTSGAPGAFDSGVLCSLLACPLSANPSFAVTFQKAGTYNYTITPGLSGKIVVVAPSPSPSPSPSPKPPPSPSPSPKPSPSPSPSPKASPSPSPIPPPSPPPSASPSPSPSPSATVTPTAASPGHGLAGTTIIALIAGIVALGCGGGLIWLRHTGAW